MYRLKELIEIATRRGIFPHATDTNSPADSHFFEVVERAKVFVFTNDSNDGRAVPQDKVEKLDLPFQTCSFEFLHGGVFHGQGQRFLIDCFLVNEIAPTQYELWYTVLDGSDPNATKMVGYCSRPEEVGPYKLYNDIEFLLKTIASSKIGFQSCKEKMRIGIGKGRKLHEIRQIIYVCKKKNLKLFTVRQAEVTWSHRWEVMGHWRRCGSIGKDREGEYTVKGFTWIKNYTKGPEQMPIVKKVRLVKK